MNIKDVERTIADLEDSDTTFENCRKLATLYIVRDNFKKHVESTDTAVEKELSDILPRYRHYIDVKRRYQMGEISEGAVIQSIKSVCREISEFIHMLYCNTDMKEERDWIINMVHEICDLGVA